MYRQHFGIKTAPLGKEQSELWDDGALARLNERFQWLLQSPGLGLLTGEAGVGKTAALRHLAHGLNPHRYQVVYLAETDFGRTDLYRSLAAELGIEPAYRRAQLWRDLKTRTQELADRKQLLLVWIIDEAQNLPPEFFRDFPAFLNFAFDSRELMTVWLVGHKVVARVPAEQLSIQWDILQEILVWENYYGTRSPHYTEEIISVLAQITNAVPSAVDLGYHYCYGSPKDEHLIQPKDMAVMVEITNLVVPRLNRPLNFIHLPVPKNRADDAYFEPLRNLKTGPGTEVYLGLVHLDDSQGNRSRLATARKYVNLVGIASECGWGRGEPERVPRLLECHRELAAGAVDFKLIEGPKDKPRPARER